MLSYQAWWALIWSTDYLFYLFFLYMQYVLVTNLLDCYPVQGLCDRCPKLSVLVITKIFFFNVSVMVNTPVCTSCFISIIILMLIYNYCHYPCILKCTVLQDVEKTVKHLIILWIVVIDLHFWTEEIVLVAEFSIIIFFILIFLFLFHFCFLTAVQINLFRLFVFLFLFTFP